MTLLSEVKNEYSGEWTPHCSEALRNALQTLSSNLNNRSKRITDTLDQLNTATAGLHIKLENTINTFDALANHQFIESRVYEDDEGVGVEQQVSVEEQPQPTQIPSKEEKQSSALRHGIAALALFALPGEAPADQYNQRPLPCLIGSHEYYSDPGLGIALQATATETESGNPKAQPSDDESGFRVTVDAEEGGLFDSEDDGEAVVSSFGREREEEREIEERDVLGDTGLSRHGGLKESIVNGDSGELFGFGSDQEIEPLQEAQDRQVANVNRVNESETVVQTQAKKKTFSGLFDSSDSSDLSEAEADGLAEVDAKDEGKVAVATVAPAQRVKGSLFSDSDSNSDSDSDSEDSGLFPSSTAAKQQPIASGSRQAHPPVVPARVSVVQGTGDDGDETPRTLEEPPSAQIVENVEGPGVGNTAFLSELNAALGQGRSPIGAAKEVDNGLLSKEYEQSISKQEGMSSTNEVLLSRPTIPSRRKRPKGRKKGSFAPPVVAPSQGSVPKAKDAKSQKVSSTPPVKKPAGLFDDSSSDDGDKKAKDKDAVPEFKSKLNQEPEPKPKPEPESNQVKKVKGGLFDDSSDEDGENDVFSSARQSTFKASSLAKTSLFGDSDSDSGLFD